MTALADINVTQVLETEVVRDLARRQEGIVAKIPGQKSQTSERDGVELRPIRNCLGQRIAPLPAGRPGRRLRRLVSPPCKRTGHQAGRRLNTTRHHPAVTRLMLYFITDPLALTVSKSLRRG